MVWKILLFTLLIPTLAFSYTVVRKDGKLFSGELISQTPQVTILKGKDGVTVKFRSDQIDWEKTTQGIRREEAGRPEEIRLPQLTMDTRQIGSREKWTGEPMTFDFKDIDIRDFFFFLAEQQGFNLIVDPAVKGTLTMKLREVPWDQALDLVCRNFGLGYEISGNVVNVKR